MCRSLADTLKSAHVRSAPASNAQSPACIAEGTDATGAAIRLGAERCSLD